MKAVCYEEPFRVAVKDVPHPELEHPDDIIVRVTTAAICGSDLHMFEGRTGAEPGTSGGYRVTSVHDTTVLGRMLTFYSRHRLWA